MNSSKNSLILLLSVMAISSLLSAQTADDIIAKHIDAHGGASAWETVEALKVTGKFTAFSLENDYACYKTRDGSYYADFFLGERRVIEAIHGDDAWTIDPWQAMDYARRLNAGEVNALMQKAEFITPFLQYHEKGHVVEYPGVDTVDGQLMHVLKLTKPNGRTETWYLDADTYLEYKCESDWVDFAQNVPAETYFDDFQLVGGLVFPFFVERTFWQRDRILLVENIEVNPEVDLAIFVMPRRPEMEDLGFLEGDWNVTLEIMTRRGTWYTMGTTTSSIAFISQNMLQEQITYERVFLISKTRNFTYSDAGENYRISEYDDLTTSLDVFEGIINDTSFVFDDVSSQFNSKGSDDTPNVRYVVSRGDKDSFVLERSVSADAGETWGPRDRFTYTRK